LSRAGASAVKAFFPALMLLAQSGESPPARLPRACPVCVRGQPLCRTEFRERPTCLGIVHSEERSLFPFLVLCLTCLFGSTQRCVKTTPDGGPVKIGQHLVFLLSTGHHTRCGLIRKRRWLRWVHDRPCRGIRRRWEFRVYAGRSRPTRLKAELRTCPDPCHGRPNLANEGRKDGHAPDCGRHTVADSMTPLRVNAGLRTANLAAP
jgi:hypothetical protein